MIVSHWTSSKRDALEVSVHGLAQPLPFVELMLLRDVLEWS